MLPCACTDQHARHDGMTACCLSLGALCRHRRNRAVAQPAHLLLQQSAQRCTAQRFMRHVLLPASPQHRRVRLAPRLERCTHERNCMQACSRCWLRSAGASCVVGSSTILRGACMHACDVYAANHACTVLLFPMPDNIINTYDSPRAHARTQALRLHGSHCWCCWFWPSSSG